MWVYYIYICVNLHVCAYEHALRQCAHIFVCAYLCMYATESMHSVCYRYRCVSTSICTHNWSLWQLVCGKRKVHVVQGRCNCSLWAGVYLGFHWGGGAVMWKVFKGVLGRFLFGTRGGERGFTAICLSGCEVITCKRGRSSKSIRR